MWATPNDATADLRDFLDARHGVNGWTFRDGVVHGGTDCLSALHDALDALRARYSYGTLRIVGGGGMFRLGGPIDTNRLRGMLIEGTHPNDARLCFDCSAGGLFQYTGGGGFTGGGMKRIKAWLESGYPLSSVLPLVLQGDASFQPDDMTFEDCYFNTLGNSTYYAGPLLYGNARTSPQGERVLNIRNMQVFNTRMYGGYFSNLVQSVVDNYGSYTPAGPDGGDIHIVGNTTGCDFRRMAASCDLIINNAHRVFVTGSAARVLADAASTSTISGFIEAPLFGAFGPGSDVSILG